MERTRDVLDYAIEREIESCELYTRWATEADDDELRRVFEELAVEEEKHRGLLLTMKRLRMRLAAPPEHPRSALPDYAREPVPEPPATLRNVLIYAIRDEQESVDLYRRLAAQAETRKINESFKALADEEIRHKERLEEQYARRFG